MVTPADPDPAFDSNPFSVAHAVARSDKLPFIPRDAPVLDQLPLVESFESGDRSSFIPYAVWLLAHCNRQLGDTVASTPTEAVMPLMPALPPTQLRAAPSSRSMLPSSSVPVTSSPLIPRQPTSSSGMGDVSKQWLFLWRQEVVLYLRFALTLPGNARLFGYHHGVEHAAALLIVPGNVPPEASPLHGTTEFPEPTPLELNDSLVQSDVDIMLSGVVPKSCLEWPILSRAAVHVLVVAFDSYAGTMERFKREDVLQVLMLSLLQVIVCRLTSIPCHLPPHDLFDAWLRHRRRTTCAL